MTDYALAISEVEVARYQMMAATAVVLEAGQLREAGIVEGAVVADIGCGPAAMSVALAAQVGPTGRVIGIERDEQALATARGLVAQTSATNVELRAGTATTTGIAPGSVDVAMMRHVLAHNGGHEQDIVDHVATLPRPGGTVYLVDSDLTGIRILDADPDLDDMSDKYIRFHANRGNDPSVGLRLGKLLQAAGLELTTFTGTYNIVSFAPGMRPPAWAAREAMLAEGAATVDDIQRWDAAFQRTDEAAGRPLVFAPAFVATGRKP
ncbi:MAG: methyltransferase domain-containing protein [Actinomycetota bacterium]|nr:methyltransferase domain-containing protein [Actinomycetota bacterium]